MEISVVCIHTWEDCADLSVYVFGHIEQISLNTNSDMHCTNHSAIRVPYSVLPKGMAHNEFYGGKKGMVDFCWCFFWLFGFRSLLFGYSRIKTTVPNVQKIFTPIIRSVCLHCKRWTDMNRASCGTERQRVSECVWGQGNVAEEGKGQFQRTNTG